MVVVSPPKIRVIDSAASLPELPLVNGGGNVRVLLWPGNNARFRSIQLFVLESGAATIPLRHKTDCVYGIVSGSGSILDEGGAPVHDLVEGSMLHIDAGDGYQFRAGDAGITFVGGPCPPDEALYENMKYLEVIPE